MAFGITDLRKGAIYQQDGVPYKVLEYSQKVMGRGGSIVSVKVKSLIDGKVLDRTYKGNEQIEYADVANKNVQYLYKDGDIFHFMDQDTYEQFEVNSDIVGDGAGYLKEGDEVQAQLFNGQVMNIELAKNVPLLVTYTENAVKGDTSSSITKDATLETGISIRVPAFIKQGDLISVNTEDGTYRERVRG
ncbi:MAG: elongation factor P [Candidatus Saccharibacteria bacterium]|nr:elongation factor P [Candidatus Saccharibacteria bacterium]